VLDVALPSTSGPELTRSFAACVASAIEVPLAALPSPPGELPSAIGRWRSWLAGRGLGLVALANPGTFNWPGYWIAVVGQQDDASAGPVAVLMFGTPAGVVLSPQADELLGRAATGLPVQQGYVLAGFDPALPARIGLPHLAGRVEALALAEVATGPMRLVETALAIADRGLAGDRYAAKAGTFTPADGTGTGYDLTLVQAEVLDDLVLDHDRRLDYAEARRNVVTRGIDLNALVGRRFRIGDVECLGQRLCEPCAHLERLTTKGVLRGLIHRGGLRADIVSGGSLRVGAGIETVD
jgi:hypothetical protein